MSRHDSLREGRGVQAELVPGLEHIWIATGVEDLLVGTVPLGLVDAVNPVLDLQDETAI